ncbi:hypothetical protein PTSG_11206 [Salpingoeca rosetta]|uniref:Uncharacterized protein n=1 Tax=Salpingoeca rosetta (strain ATCC 50818 / BSB-021) TaxID=946362 RepID=F2USQ7_SALR5|nr:uncharacterized protein PTSG_11206 [Salpingoeca rosetta]EGD81166.1 hypothetical protein PTSG_11206 [Salpingoeca rosetta]|eukprot:XP_004987851.1 hypothetical protein PTSG_11206 [Salpingoeca rosetta]
MNDGAAWALVAETLVLEAEQAAKNKGTGVFGGQLDSKPQECPPRDVARAYFNLMLTCRELYHDLPWAMPKWCLSTVFTKSTNVWNRQSRTTEHWVDVFQRDLLVPAHAATTSAMMALAMAMQTTALPLQEDDTAHVVVWLENRFLAYCWLGVAWKSTCTFLRSRLQSPPQTQSFWHRFARSGHVTYTSLEDVESWAADVNQALDASEHDSSVHGADARKQEGGTSTSTDAGGTSTRSAQPQHSQKQQQHVGDRVTVTAAFAPALFSLTAEFMCQGDADRWHELRTSLLANSRGVDVNLVIQSPLESLSACHIDFLDIQSTEIGHVTIHDVKRVTWCARNQRTLRGDIQHMQRFELSDSTSISDLGMLNAGIPEIRLARLYGRSLDLSPLLGVEKLDIVGAHLSGDDAVVTAAQHLSLRQVQLQNDKLDGTRITLSHMLEVPRLLHLPNATHIELRLRSKVKTFTCPTRVDRIVIADETPFTMPQLPDFVHANVLALKLFRRVLSREFLVDLGRRTDKLVLKDCVRNVSALNGIPDHVHVCVDGVNVDGPVPPCVKELHGLVKGELHCEWIGPAVQSLTLHGRFQYPMHGIHLLSDRQYLRLTSCTLDQDIARCHRASLHSCCGRVGFTSIGTLLLDELTVRAAPAQHVPIIAPSNVVSDGPGSLSITGCREVFNCHLHKCAILEFDCFQGIQRLVLQSCAFDNMHGLSDIGCVVLRNCYSTNYHWRWPDVSLVNRF